VNRTVRVRGKKPAKGGERRGGEGGEGVVLKTGRGNQEKRHMTATNEGLPRALWEKAQEDSKKEGS